MICKAENDDVLESHANVVCLKYARRKSVKSLSGRECQS